MLRIVGLMVTAAAVVACTGNSATPTSSVPSTAPTTVTTAVETTSSQATATTTAAPATTIAAEPPIPNTTGDDWTRIMTEIYAFIGWLYQNPDSTLLDQVIVPGSEFDQNLGGVVRQYEADGWRELPGGESELREASLQTGTSRKW